MEDRTEGTAVDIAAVECIAEDISEQFVVKGKRPHDMRKTSFFLGRLLYNYALYESSFRWTKESSGQGQENGGD